MSKVSIYSDIRNIDRGHNIDIDLALERIKLGRSKDIVEQIRYNLKEGNLEEAKKLKTFKLPYVCFSGTFTRRDDDSIVDHSGFAILDFDHLPEDIMVECKNFLKGHTFVHSYWRSPSGDGLKVLIRIPNSIQDHKDYYLGIVKHFSEYKEYLDETSINLSRACFESYDPQIYINEDSEEFVEKYVSVAITYTAPESIRTDYAKVNVAANIIRHSLPGEMHAKLLDAANLMGGYIVTGVVGEEEATRILVAEIEAKGKTGEALEAAKVAIKKGIAHGKTRPLSELLAAANEEEILEGILTLDKVKDQMAANFKFGSKKGMTTGIPHVDRVFKWMKGFTYVFAGYANHGKTEFLNYLMLMKSLKDGFKWAVFSPEGHTPDTFYDNLIHMYAGQTTDHRSDNQLSMTRYWEAAEFIKKHFFFIYPKKEHSAENINAIFKYLVDKENVDGCVIDPYNQLSFDSTGSEYLQIRNFLQLQRRFYIENNVIGIIVAHPKNPSPNDNGSIDPPQVYQISGGAEWNNKSDVIMTYHRPNFYVDISDTACIFGTKKVKRQKDMALPGDIDMRFDRKTNRFVFLDPSVSQSFIDYMQEHFDSQKVQPNNNLENLF
jgi:hypothetical protein